ncbi:actin [Popillia japonica]|uniref:Actin n=1 Tax=Popillia japonica TaxID=7064 RepID=A0AAW1IVX0_POPJA
MPIYEGYGTITDKLTFIIDIGAAYTKIGFSAEFAPRAIVASEVRCKNTNQVRNIYDYKDKEDLYDLLVEFIHLLYFKYALISPKDRAVVIVESLLCPTLFRETLAKVLFYHYEVASLLVVPSHLVSLATLAIDTGLVLDIGYTEAVAIPICHGSPVLHAWQALPLGSQAIHSHVKTLLSADNTGIQNISESVLEDIKVRCCFVTKRERAEKLRSVSSDIAPCPSVVYPLGGTKSLNVSGKLREMMYEIFFDEDLDHLCISTMILNVIASVDVESRTLLAENIVLIGGTCMAPGFKARLKAELYRQLKNERYSKFKNIKTIKFHTPPAKENYTAWLGAAIYGATEIVSMKALSKDQYFKEKRLPDWWSNLKDVVRSI